MTSFDLLFLFLVLVTSVTLVAAAVSAIGGGFARAGRILGRLGIGAVACFTLVIVGSAPVPRRVYQVGDAQCFDDWCITVVEAGWPDTPPDAAHEVLLRLSNRAKRAPMGEKGTVVYLTDATRRRYDPVPDPAAERFDAILQPGESSVTRRRFDVPHGARGLGLVYTHEGGFPIE